MSISKSLGRTVKTNIILYKTDNKGRDGYITFNDGGFWKDNIKQIKLKSNFPRHINNTFHSLIHQAAPINYYSDGRGRDTYVVKNNAGLVKEFCPLASRQFLSQYLRKDNFPISYDKRIKYKNFFLTPSDKENYLKINKIQNNVVWRLYDECLDKFRERMNYKSPLTKDSLNQSFFNTSNNYPYINSEPTLLKIENKRSLNKNMNQKSIRKMMRYKVNRTHNNFFNYKKANKKDIIKNLKINNTVNNNIKNYFDLNKTCNNLDNKNKENCLTSANWNPIISKYNSINDCSRRNIDTSYNEYNKKKKNENINLNQCDISYIEKNKTMMTEVNKERPLSCRRFFNKTQIFNRFKPFLVDEFQDYSDYE